MSNVNARMLPTDSFIAEALDLAKVGAWRWDRTTGLVVWNRRLEEVFGLEPGSFSGTFDGWLSHIHPEDRQRTAETVDEAIAARTWFRFDHRCVWPDGSVHWLEGRGDVLVDEAGEVVGAAGITIDVDSRRASDDERHRLMEAQRAARQSAEAAWRRLARLQHVAVRLAGASTVDEVAEVLVADGSEALGADGGFFSIVDGDREELILRAARGAREDIVDHYRHVPLDGDSPPARVVESNRPIFVSSEDERQATFPGLDDQGAAAFAILPISTRGHVAAVLAFGFSAPHAFSTDERELMATITGISAQALHRAELHDVARLSALRSSQLERVTARLAGARNGREVGDIVVEELVPAVGALGGSLFLADEAGGSLRALVIYGYPHEVIEAYGEVPLDRVAPVVDAFRSGWPVFIETDAEWRDRYPEVQEDAALSGVGAECQLPLVVDDRPVGTIGFSFKEHHRFDGAERQHLGIIAAICGQALGRAMAFEDSNRAHSRLESIDEITDTALSQLHLEDLLEQLPRRVAGSIGCAVVRILLLEGDGKHLREHGRFGTSDEPSVLVPVGRGLAGRVAASGTPIVFDDISQHEVISPGLPDDITTVAGFPLKSGGRVIGVLDVGAGPDRPFSEEDLELLELAGDRIAVAIERSSAFEIERAARLRSEFMSRLGEVVHQGGPLESIVRDIAHLGVGSLADWCVLTVINDSGPPVIAPAHTDPAMVELVRSIVEAQHYDAAAERGAAAVIRTGRTEFYPQIDGRMIATISDPELRELVRSLDLRSSITVALRGSSSIVGAMQLVRSGEGSRFGPDDVALAEEVGARIGAAIEARLSLLRHRATAMTLQQSLLPSVLPEITGGQLAIRYWPASDLFDVGGDFFDVIDLAPNKWGVLIGDVSGKGVSAAAMTGIARHTTRAAARHGYGPAEVLQWIHDAFLTQSETTESYCSAVYGVLESAGDHLRFRFAVGGHPLPIVRPATGSSSYAGIPGTALGLIDPITVSMSEVILRNGDWLVLYTDGVTDVPVADAITDQELIELIDSVCVTSPEDALDSLEEVLKARYGHLSNRDDTAVLMVRCMLGSADRAEPR